MILRGRNAARIQVSVPILSENVTGIKQKPQNSMIFSSTVHHQLRLLVCALAIEIGLQLPTASTAITSYARLTLTD